MRSWAAFLKEHRFLVGLSIDGPRELHDRFRVNKGGAPTFDKVMAAAKLLRKLGVRFNTLTCVHRFNASRPLDVYRFLRSELNSTYIQFIPIVQAKGFETTAPQAWDATRLPIVGTPEARPDHPNAVVTDWSVDPEDYGYFLSRVFDEWRRKDFGKVLVNHFETLVAQHSVSHRRSASTARSAARASPWSTMAASIPATTTSIPSIAWERCGKSRWRRWCSRPTQVKFGYAKSETLPAYCRDCSYLKDCWGECPKNRLIRTPDGEPGLNYLCAGLKKFYSHALPEVERIAGEIRKQQRPPPEPRAPREVIVP